MDEPMKLLTMSEWRFARLAGDHGKWRNHDPDCSGCVALAEILALRALLAARASTEDGSREADAGAETMKKIAVGIREQARKSIERAGIDADAILASSTSVTVPLNPAFHGEGMAGWRFRFTLLGPKYDEEDES